MFIGQSFARSTRLVIAIAFLASGCDDASPSVTGPTAPPPPASGVVAYIAVSSTSPQVGTELDVSFHTSRARGIAPIGSYTVRLTYDSTRLRFLGAVSDPAGLVAANAMGGRVMVAGASTEGFSARLAGLRMQVLAPGALDALRLEIVEITAADFSNQTKAAKAADVIYEVVR